MRNREVLITKIISHLAILKGEVSLRSKVNLQDINIHAEQFYKIMLNDILDINLENINIVEQNVAVIDLGDRINKIAIQVTSDNSKNKIKETVSAFNEKELYKHYNKLKILVIKDKIKRDDVIKNDNFSFDMGKDVIDVPYIITKIQDIDDLDKVIKIEKWLSDELVHPYYKSKIESKPNEVKTFINLIDFISDEDNHKTFKTEDEPDPKYKIEKRFKEYATFLKKLYSDLYLDYAYALELAENNTDISSVKIRKIGAYLKDVSNKHLMSSDNNPEDALENLSSFFNDLFIKEGLSFDQMAVKFYLIHQLIRCNVFPN
ncbi:SMEK domain-containing protein [Flavivirga amylovorans]|uniref:SMEK domain-containing protein n=1 Tax=Flavivirga amylovorans TaxID=870486 RepID=A0ABT8X1K8_9FLAO|nr:SMEK domain-containing protein [Flavivirga amylovorans]MDO5987800.1 SMEK domain-containing protein [Flavivirga amylovorans]